MKEVLKNIFMNKKVKNTLIISMFIFIIEILFKVLSSTFTFDYTILRILLSSIIIGYICNVTIRI